MAEESKLGLVGSIVAGVGALVLVVIITFIVVSTMDNANLLRSTATTSTKTNEVGYLNQTGYTLVGFDGLNRSLAVVQVVNYTNGTVIAASKYSFNSGTGIITNATTTTWDNVTINYTYISPTTYEDSTDRMTGNFTSGVGNVSSKVPTVLLIAAVVLLFGVIVYLVRQSQAMGIGGTKGGSL